MERYNSITNKIKREIVLLKGAPCRWGRCSFCDYIDDNSDDEELCVTLNSDVLNNITGKYGVLEVINSGNIFELPSKTLSQIKEIIKNRGIHTLFFESHWIYRKKIGAMREFFGINTIVKTGLESFDYNFRENVLIKGFGNPGISELKEFFDSVCLLVGVKGQSKEMIKQDIELAMNNFDHFTVNIFIENSTDMQGDRDLIQWFQNEYKWLNNEEKCDVLWFNTDFGVGD